MANKKGASSKGGLQFSRRFTSEDVNVYDQFEYDYRTSVIRNPSGEVVFEMNNVEVPKQWSQIATDILHKNIFEKQVFRNRMEQRAEKHLQNRLHIAWPIAGGFGANVMDYFASEKDAQVFYEEMVYCILNQMCVPNSPQWFNTGLHESYGITGKPQGHYYVDPDRWSVEKITSAYERPQPHACFILSVDG